MSSPQISQEMAEAGPVAVAPPQPALPNKLPTNPRRSFWRSSSGRLLIAVIVLFSLRTFVGEASVVPTGSMEGTILVGDHLFLDKLLYGPEVPLTSLHLPRLKTIRRGDIIVFRYPRNPAEAFLKRVVAVGGDQVEIRDAVVYINSRPVQEPYAVHRRSRYGVQEQMAPVTVPKDSLFVMGDNRDNSSDSREWGFVPVDNVIGEPIFVYWSYDAPTSRWLEPGIGGQMSFYASIAAHFFSHTRWSRMGMWL